MQRLLLFSACLVIGACGGSGDVETTGGEADPLVAATAAVHAEDAPDPSPITATEPSVPVIEQEFAYGSAEDHNLVGFFAMPQDVAEPLPGLIVVHEWWGLNDNIRAVTRQLAAEGYAVLAVDLYGGPVAADPEQAEALMTGVMSNRDAAIENLRQAHAYLKQYALAPTVGVVGWCLGGGWALEAALDLGSGIDAVVMYYGQVVTDDTRLQTLTAPLLGHFAELDEAVSLRSVQSFRGRLRELGKPAEVLIYTGVAHAFANPSGGAYDERAAAEAWTKTLAFLGTNLASGE